MIDTPMYELKFFEKKSLEQKLVTSHEYINKLLVIKITILQNHINLYL
jgi:hypothetical protein